MHVLDHHLLSVPHHVLVSPCSSLLEAFLFGQRGGVGSILEVEDLVVLWRGDGWRRVLVLDVY